MLAAAPPQSPPAADDIDAPGPNLPLKPGRLHNQQRLDRLKSFVYGRNDLWIWNTRTGNGLSVG
jgi:hypothetical protein